MTVPVRIDLADAATFPSRRIEDWRWTDVRAKLREAPPSSAPLRDAPIGPFDGVVHRSVVFGNGRTDDDAAEAAFDLADGEVLGLCFVGAGSGGHQSDVEILVPSGVSAVILESHTGEGAYVSNIRQKIKIGEGATLTRVILADEPAAALSFSTAEVDLGAGGRFEQTTATAGARLQRIETRVRHGSLGATARLDGIYLLGGDRHADQTSEVDHLVRDGVTTQLCKGFVGGQARGVFQGRIIVRKGADGTDARMGHHALIGSDRGEVDAKPELEIYADDVACAHGATVGALDPAQLFYLQARGMPEPLARALLTQAFIGEVLDRVELEPVREILRLWAAERLEGTVHGL